MVQLSHPYMTTGKTIVLTIQTFVYKVTSLLFNMLSRLIIGEGNGNPLQYSCLENSMDGGAWWATVHGVAESDTTEWLHFYFQDGHSFSSKEHLLISWLQSPSSVILEPKKIRSATAPTLFPSIFHEGLHGKIGCQGLHFLNVEF